MMRIYYFTMYSSIFYDAYFTMFVQLHSPVAGDEDLVQRDAWAPVNNAMATIGHVVQDRIRNRIYTSKESRIKCQG
jgi:hypothetical protein